MTFLMLLALAAILSFLLLKYPSILLAGCAVVAWLALMVFTVDNPPSALIPVGSTVHEMLLMGMFGVATAIGFTAISRLRKPREERDYQTDYNEPQRNNNQARIMNRPPANSKRIMDMDVDEYSQYISGNGRRRRR
jgi:hypothetical protein